MDFCDGFMLWLQLNAQGRGVVGGHLQIRKAFVRKHKTIEKMLTDVESRRHFQISKSDCKLLGAIMDY